MEELVLGLHTLFDAGHSSSVLHQSACYFNIPDYQRGYEWSADSVQLLLDDLKKYTENVLSSGNQDNFYCLQHITLLKKEAADHQKYYNLVDGQQRLTTLAIILSFFGQGELFQGKLHYSVRQASAEMLEQFIFTGRYWTETHNPASYKDQFYIMQSADVVSAWSQQHSEWLLEHQQFFVREILLHRTKLIVNEVAGDEEQIFATINGAKAELDGADLLRAIQITRAAKEKINPSSIADNRVNELRVKMGMELDQINLWCGQEEVRAFLKGILHVSSAKDGHFDAELYPINYLYRILYEIHKKDSSDAFDFRFFEYGMDLKKNGSQDDTLELYDELKRIFAMVYTWYKDSALYHYIAYLSVQFKSSFKFMDLYEAWCASTSKTDFGQRLKAKITSSILLSFGSSDSESSTQPCTVAQLQSKIRNVDENWYDDGNLGHLLVLLDVIISTQSNSVQRLPWEYFAVCEKDDKEHIGSQTPNKDDAINYRKWLNRLHEIQNVKGRIDGDVWSNELQILQQCAQPDVLKQVIHDLENAGLAQFAEPLEKHLQNILQHEGETSETVHDNHKDKVWSIIRHLNQTGLNAFGNMVLLDQAINRGYQNKCFLEKKQQILQDYFENRYIRPYTFKVFSSTQKDEWTLTDIQTTAEQAAVLIGNFMQTPYGKL